MKRLYDEVGKFTTEGMQFLKEITDGMYPIFSNYRQQGFEVREIGHAAGFAVHDVENIMCLKDMHAKVKEKNKNENDS